ncbi:MAG: glycosyltransferase family 2 protein [Clostridiales bacterium]
MMDLSIGIVTYNNEDKIEDLLRDIYRYTRNVNFKVYVIDNKSKDSTVALVRQGFPQVEIIETHENKGFGNGHNRILNKIDSRYHLVLNPDIRFDSNVIRSLLDYMDSHENVAMVTPRVMNIDGTEQYLPKRLPSFRYMVCGRLQGICKKFADIRAEYTMSDIKITEPTEIQCCTGCFMLLRTEIFKKCNGFNEEFFMYLEDAELTLRASAYGKIIFYPLVCVTHAWERTSAKNPKYLFIHIQSMFKFLRIQKKW